MKKKIILIIILVFFFAIAIVNAGSISIVETIVLPSTVTAGNLFLITCKCMHSDGPEYIDRVAARVSIGNFNTSYPVLYDDGIHGDQVAGDGIYSLEINAGSISGEAEIVFIAVDKDGNEVESDPITLTIQEP